MATQKKESEIDPQRGNQYTDPTYNVLQLVEAAVKRLDDLSSIRADCTHEVIALNKEILSLHIAYSEKLSLAESKRIDAIRAVDVGAVAIANERAVGQATVLANQLTASADILRTLVTTTATTTQTQVINPLIDRIALLEKSQYEGKGKGSGIKDLYGWFIAAALLVVAILAYFKK